MFTQYSLKRSPLFGTCGLRDRPASDHGPGTRGDHVVSISSSVVWPLPSNHSSTSDTVCTLLNPYDVPLCTVGR